MAIKSFNVTLEESVVEEAKQKMSTSGAKLSPVINLLIKIWLAFPEEIARLMSKLNQKEGGQH